MAPVRHHRLLRRLELLNGGVSSQGFVKEVVGHRRHGGLPRETPLQGRAIPTTDETDEDWAPDNVLPADALP